MEVRVLKSVAAAERLEALGVKEDWFRKALEVAELARDSCGPLHAPTFPGLSAWSHRIERLRIESGHHGWKPINVRNMPMIESPDGQIAIVCIPGDERTGLEGPQPRTRHDRGPVTEAAIDQNVEQLSFLNQLPGLIERRQRLHHSFLYVLLSYRNGSTVRCELSLPFSMDDQGRVSEWTERILLAPIDLTPSVFPREEQRTQKIEVAVSRK